MKFLCGNFWSWEGIEWSVLATWNIEQSVLACWKKSSGHVSSRAVSAKWSTLGEDVVVNIAAREAM